MKKKLKTSRFSIFKSKIDKIIDSNKKTILGLFLALFLLFLVGFISSLFANAVILLFI